VWVFNANYDGTIIYNDPVCIPVACKYIYIYFFVFMEIREENQTHVAGRYLR
jgi:hypothetical protein